MKKAFRLNVPSSVELAYDRNYRGHDKDGSCKRETHGDQGGDTELPMMGKVARQSAENPKNIMSLIR